MRRDPKRSHIDGIREGHLKGDGYRPNDFHYVFADKSSRYRGPEYYEMLGYRIMTVDDHIEVTGRFRQKDKQIEYMGHYLMCISKSERRDIEQFGVDGQGGLQETAKIEKLLIGKGHKGADPLRGISGIRGTIRVSRREEDLDGSDDEPFDDDEEG